MPIKKDYNHMPQEASIWILWTMNIKRYLLNLLPFKFGSYMKIKSGIAPPLIKNWGNRHYFEINKFLVDPQLLYFM